MEFSALINSIYLYGGHVAVVCLLINVAICLLYFKSLDVPFRRLCYFLFFNLVIEIVARSLAYAGINNLPLLHLYTLGEFILLSYFYQSLIKNSNVFKNYFWQFVASICVLILLNSAFFQSIYTFNSIAKTLVQVIIISYAVFYFYKLTENHAFQFAKGKSLRLINSAFLIYYSGTLFIFMCSQIYINDSDTYKLFWAFNAILNLIFQLLIFWGIWMVVSNKIPLSSS